jgi:hypothetical protein
MAEKGNRILLLLVITQLSAAFALRRPGWNFVSIPVDEQDGEKVEATKFSGRAVNGEKSEDARRRLAK